MGRYEARDLVRIPGLLSLSRIPLAAAFALAVHEPTTAFAVLLAAGITDIADGWYARTFHQVTPTGAALDGVTDKLFVATVAVTLVATGHLAPWSVALLGTREIGELPLVLWVALSRRARRARSEQATANAIGKVATALQFVAVSAALFHAPYARGWVVATAVAGAAAAFSYWRRAFRIVAVREAT